MTTENSSILEAIECALAAFSEKGDCRNAGDSDGHSASVKGAIAQLAQAAERLRAGRVTLFDPAREILRRFPELESDDDLPGADAVDRLCQWLADLDPAELERQLPVPSDFLVEQARRLHANPEEGSRLMMMLPFRLPMTRFGFRPGSGSPSPPNSRQPQALPGLPIDCLATN